MHGCRTEHDHVRAILLDRQHCLFPQLVENHLFLAGQQFGDIRTGLDRAQRGHPLPPAIFGQSLLVERKPFRPHRQHGEFLAQHHRGGKGRFPWPDHRNIEPGAKRAQAAVADGVDQYSGIAFFLGRDSGLEHGPVHQQCVVVAVAKGGAPGYGDEFGLETGPDEIGGQLLCAGGHAGLIHRDGDNDLYPLHSNFGSGMAMQILPDACILYTIGFRQAETARTLQTCPSRFIPPIAGA